MIKVFRNICLTTTKNVNVNMFHTAPASLAWSKSVLPKRFLEYNKKVFPPQEIGEEKRPAFVCHQLTNIKYSPEKLWYIAVLVRGMTVDEAVKQLSFVNKKGAKFVKQAILEAQELAVKEHNVEFRSNLWIAESFSGKGTVIKGIRRHARGRMGEVRYQYSHYFVRLEEGKPPKDYYKIEPLTPQQQLDKWLEQMRKRKITNSY
ncbi:39S ribosomal protein L22, mitochondrial [Ostrinia furnacalis]|uniref:39S ribosomal protein L22, mitochondrial n=1 Tax=Ostrinia furnacalis TaxID=93504 RepID=UPI00103CE5A5|nr:39S ribosomal protein L22, mitochondrial [Ostrinia furnacalis]